LALTHRLLGAKGNREQVAKFAIEIGYDKQALERQMRD